MKKCRIRWYGSDGDRLRANEAQAMLGWRFYETLRTKACRGGQASHAGIYAISNIAPGAPYRGLGDATLSERTHRKLMAQNLRAAHEEARKGYPNIARAAIRAALRHAREIAKHRRGGYGGCGCGG